MSMPIPLAGSSESAVRADHHGRLVGMISPPIEVVLTNSPSRFALKCGVNGFVTRIGPIRLVWSILRHLLVGTIEKVTIELKED
jgi:hypothetical protein